MNRAWLLLPLTLLIGGALIGCDVQPPVNRVQANVTRKADILGSEWYSLSTVVDTPYSADFTFVGEQGTLERIRWEIQEDFLVGRRSYETIAGADPEGINGTDESAAAPVAMFKILKHFDIRHQYNPVTGEKMNVIEENATDRLWHQRDYMRVDWSKNLVNDPNFMMLSRFFNALEMEPVSWFVQQEEGIDSPNAPKFVRAEEEEGPVDHVKLGDITYMEITNKMFVKPTNYILRGFGPIPACWLLQVMDGNPVDCASSEITVRHSFLRVDPNHDYEPQVYTGDRMERFGYFVTERPGYDAHYGLIEPLRYRFVNRHNLWKQSHKRDGDEFVTCIEDADCDDGRGSYCDLDFGRARRQLTEDDRIEGACTIPYRDREVRPVVYHLTENWPDEFLPEAEMVAREYSDSFGNVIASLRELECEANEPEGTDCSAERGREDQGSVFYVCQSPVPAGAPEACGPEGTVGRIGDLRFSLIAWVNEPHRSSPLGYGPSAADPLTGEIIAGNSFIYGAGVDTISTFGRDIVKLLNGELTEEEVAAGAPVDAWAMRLSGEMRGQSTRTAHDHTVPVDGLDIARINEAMDFSWARTPGSEHASRGPAQSPAELVERMQTAMRRIRDTGVAGDGIDRGGAALARLKGTDIEAWMTTPEMLAAANIDPGTPLDDSVLEMASPLRAQRAQSVIERLRLRDRIQQQQGVDWGDFGDEGLLGLARDIVRKADAGEPMTWNGVDYHFHKEDGTVDYAKVRDMLRHPIMSGLTLHEVGHTVGLRHNFSGSYDALNYHPRYWELRDDGDMRPRAWDPITDEEINGRIYEYSYSTVMDYGHNFVVSDAQGLGHYDHAALKMGYGDLVEVFTEPTRNNTEVAWATYIQMLGWPVTLTLEAGTGGRLTAYPYTEWPALLGGRENMEKRADVPYTSLTSETVLGASGIDFPAVDAQQRIAVPYRFCSDEQRDLNTECFLYDSGADPYESIQSVIDSYWNYYIFNSYRRGRIGFNSGGVANRIFGRYFEKLQRANQTYSLYRTVFQEGWGNSPGFEDFFEAERGFGAFTAAVGAAFQTLTRVIAAPEPGGYSLATRGDGSQAYMPGGNAVRVDGYDGRYLETTWDFDAGYFWFDQLERVGYFYDKAYALIALSDPTTYFLGRDTDADIRRYQLNFSSSFGPAMTSFFGGILGEDWNVFAPRVDNGTLVYPDPLEMVEQNMGGTPVSPNVSFSIQLYASVFGMSYIPETYDQDFLNRSRIFVRGGAEEIQIDPSLPQIEYMDPRSGITYVAVSYLDDDGVEQGVGAKLLNHAKALAARAGDEQAEFELRRFVDNIDLVRRLTWQLGFGAQP